MKDHELAKLTNELTEIAKKYGHMQQLRQRISSKLQEYIKTDNSESNSIGTFYKEIIDGSIPPTIDLSGLRRPTIDLSGLRRRFGIEIDDDAVSIPVSKKVKMRFGKPKRMEFPGGDEE